MFAFSIVNRATTVIDCERGGRSGEEWRGAVREEWRGTEGGIKRSRLSGEKSGRRERR